MYSGSEHEGLKLLPQKISVPVQVALLEPIIAADVGIVKKILIVKIIRRKKETFFVVCLFIFTELYFTINWIVFYRKDDKTKHVIASPPEVGEAIPIISLKKVRDCFVATAPRNDIKSYYFFCPREI